MNKRLISFAFAFSFAFVSSSFLHAAVPSTITYQGSLKEFGSPVNRTVAMEFRLTNEDGSQLYWTSGSMNVDIQEGLYRVELSPDTMDWAGVSPYMETLVEGNLLLPREKLTSAPYALVAKRLEEDVEAPPHPAFLVYLPQTEFNVTGDSSKYTVPFDGEVFDQGDNFSSNTFTAPVDGIYLLITTLDVSEIYTSNHNEVNVNIVTSNRTYVHKFSDIPTSLGRTQVSFSTLADMDAGDTAKVELKVDGSSKIVDIGGSGAALSRFSGTLIE